MMFQVFLNFTGDAEMLRIKKQGHEHFDQRGNLASPFHIGATQQEAKDKALGNLQSELDGLLLSVERKKQQIAKVNELPT